MADEVKLLKQLRLEGEKAWAQERFTDLKVTYLGSTWNLHRIIICSRSDWFLKACTAGFKESNGVIKIEAIEGTSSVVMGKAFEAMYTLNYRNEKDSSKPDDPQIYDRLIESHKMYQLSEYFQAPLLHELAATRIAESIDTFTTHYRNRKSTDKFKKESAGFVKAIGEIYAAGLRPGGEMRAAIVEAIAPWFSNFIRDVNGFRGLVSDRATPLASDYLFLKYLT